ncbi:MAG: FAD-binding oxidoreductase, partial [Gemmatimonadota bacterium]|nr:FAD-binding oxidoreductase [Gemmatimonadota bacterium]
IVEYVPGDLTMTVRAGASLAMLDEVASREGQWMGIDPAGSTAGTIGATVASASAGPLSHGIGRVRDIVLGIEVVTGNGNVIRSGGKVVKNVAGFDITRLQVGAWGTLGIITEVSLRLRARPEVDETVSVCFDARKPLLAQLVSLREIPLAALAVELIGATLAQQLGLGETQQVLVRLGGNETRVRAQRAALTAIGDVTIVPAEVWTALRNAETKDAAVARVSHMPSLLASSWSHVANEVFSVMHVASVMRATVSRGAIRVVIPASPALANEEAVAALASIVQTIAPPGGHVVWEQLPDAVWKHVPSAVADELSLGLQRAFDPAGRCNPGILGGTRSQ